MTRGGPQKDCEERARSLQREAQHIGHFVGIDKDDWMCRSLFHKAFGWLKA